MDSSRSVQGLSALANETRLRVVERLAGSRTGEIGASELAAGLGISRPSLSMHLAILSASGLVTARRAGRTVSYALEREALDALGRQLVALADRTV